jgi:hypothetical protein
MKVIVWIAIIMFLSSCDSLSYRKGETDDKEAAINKIAPTLYRCFSTSTSVPEFSFTIVRPKPRFSFEIKRYGILNDPKTISSSQGGDDVCLERNLRGLKVPILSLVDFEKVRFKWQHTRWVFVPNDAYL